MTAIRRLAAILAVDIVGRARTRWGRRGQSAEIAKRCVPETIDIALGSDRPPLNCDVHRYNAQCPLHVR
jgi:hypothetical protein